MRILSIHGKNLASLAGEFSLDFRQGPLADAGIFAITGPTGAGKSTLLDAMCLALFDSLPRLDDAPRSGESTQDALSPSDPRGILRHGTGDGYAAIEFVGRDGHTYRSEWSVQRARKRPDGSLQLSKMALTCLDANPALPDKKKDIKEYILKQIGLNDQQFRRAVVLAQGEFEAFIKASGDERAQLLEKLTGTAIYTRIGQLAFEKASAVKKTYQLIEQQITARDCLDPTARADLEEQCATAQNAFTASSAHLQALQTLQTWHAKRTEHATRLEQARKTLADAKTAQANAAPRRAALNRNRQALALVDVWQNSLDAKQESKKADAALEQSRIAEQEALDAVRKAEQEQAKAESALTQAQQQQKEAAPQLAAARKVDQALETARKACATAHKTFNARTDENTRAQKQAQQATAALGNAQTLQADLQKWLRTNQPLERLVHDEHDITNALTARDALHKNIEALQSALAEQTEELAKAQAATDTAQQHQTEAEASLQRAAETLATARNNAPSALRRDAVYEEYAALSKIAQDNTVLQKDLSFLDQTRQEHETLQADIARLADERQTRQKEREHAEQALPELRIRAEEKRKAATRLAAAMDGTVLALREALMPGAPCPVCGATEHHLASLATVLDDAVTQARAEAAEAEQTLRATEQRLSELNAQDSAASTLRKQMESQQQSLSQRLAEHENACKLATTALHEALRSWNEAPDPDAEALTRRLRARLDRLTQDKTAMAQAQEDLDRADKAEREARATHKERCTHADHAAECLRTAQSAYKITQDTLKTETHRLEEQDRFLAGRLDTIAPDWRNLPNPGQWLAHKTAEWRDRNTRLQAVTTELPGLTAEAARTAQANLTTQQQRDDAQKALIEAQTDLSNREQERASLLGGQSVDTVENALAEAMQTATKQEKQARDLHENAKLSAAKAHTLHQEAERTVTSTGEKQAACLRILNERLAASSLTREDVEQASSLGVEHLENEEKSLDTLEKSVTTAQATVTTHERLLNDHDATRPTDPTPEGLSLEEAVKHAADKAGQAETTLQDLEFRRRQDDEARDQTEKLRAELKQARQKGRVWEELNDLLGDAKGKTLRGFAQNLTLDRLLGFANEKLAGLKPRYTLQRAGGDTPDSTMLIEVVDNDMAGQTRGLHNLSGGERFLVSLSLALGLSEMSCGQGVRIESLFIDEGFGSLDSASLGQAIALLEDLQAQGRRVGVISHVEELKERISTKVEITPSANGRSTLNITTD
ncbi:AAA family ATPase [Acetobacter peroxydans]|jgi:exonuclease SbcC|uniref:AAA family ATPase n=1 Tax=Acetobacter peroxydans TaxID=104098 RepID=UPI00235798BB|nr:AAA family ATPase [Acetobacter peroxydans]MCH4143125.1 exonuclease SbcC [Acetobacter peroxydans]MCI1395183.1 exonuclease SbcC [Acetobacter peroxydans]MCI1410671.1 exonuclease SbcC [Acetobacter peroxydans]MCI1565943.1 exonuclease SbcC [Acetobacter peroxydans]MCI1618106.1 exonuclease SbcC [Acetobacter peroxydans]